MAARPPGAERPRAVRRVQGGRSRRPALPQGGFTPPEEEKDGAPGKGGAFSGGDVRQTSNPHTKHIFLRDKKRK